MENAPLKLNIKVFDESKDFNKVDTAEKEPLLKYQRIGKHVRTILNEKSVSCMALHAKFMCIGTFTGSVHMLDLHGTHIRRLHKHFKKVTDISIDSSGEYIATGSFDGVVAINCISEADTPAEVASYNYISPIYAAQLQPSSTVNGDRVFAAGGIAGQMIVNRKGWIIQKEITIHEGEGPIDCIRWNQGLVAWANDWGVKVYDIERERRIAYVERPQNCPPLELARCHLVWEDQDTLIIGWADCIKIMRVSRTETEIVSDSEGFAQMIAVIHTDFFISGVSAWDKDTLAVLAYKPPGFDDDAEPKSSTMRKVDGEGDNARVPLPELHLMSKASGQDLTADALPLRGYERLRASDYKLVSTHGAVKIDGPPVLYVMAPKDIIIVRARDIDDKVSWALSVKDYVRAIEIAKTNPSQLRKNKMEDIVNYYLGYLVSKGAYEQAAEVMPELLVDSQETWEQWVWVFAQKGQLSAIAPFIPTRNPKLSNTLYDIVLRHYLDTDHGQFLETLRQWPKPVVEDQIKSKGNAAAPEYEETSSLYEPLYNAEEWINRLESLIRHKRMAKSSEKDQSSSTSYLVEALAELYTVTEQFDNALRIYLSQGSANTFKERVFRIIAEHNLWSSIEDKIPSLVAIDQEAAIQMFVSHVEQLPIASIVDQLSHDRKSLHDYLHRVFVQRLGEYNIEIYAKFHELQVELYAEYDPDSLLPFIRTSNFVSLEKTYECSKAHDPPLWDCMTYTLSRMGNHRGALDLILTQIGSIEQAIEFVKHNDEGLWDYLIDLSLQRTDFVEELLKHACSHKLDPRKVVPKIPLDMKIDRLKEKLEQIMTNYRLQETMHEGCKQVFESDSFELLKKLVVRRRAGTRVTAGSDCHICRRNLHVPARHNAALRNKQPGQNKIAVFPCRHIFHTKCLQDKLELTASDDHRAYICFVCNQRENFDTDNDDIGPVKLAPRGLSEAQLLAARSRLD